MIRRIFWALSQLSSIHFSVAPEAIAHSPLPVVAEPLSLLVAHPGGVVHGQPPAVGGVHRPGHRHLGIARQVGQREPAQLRRQVAAVAASTPPVAGLGPVGQLPGRPHRPIVLDLVQPEVIGPLLHHEPVRPVEDAGQPGVVPIPDLRAQGRVVPAVIRGGAEIREAGIERRRLRQRPAPLVGVVDSPPAHRRRHQIASKIHLVRPAQALMCDQNVVRRLPPVVARVDVPSVGHRNWRVVDEILVVRQDRIHLLHHQVLSHGAMAERLSHSEPS